jgi:hypothetical protein
MEYSKFIRDDIDFKILSNYPFYGVERIKDFNEFKNRLKDYDLGVWVDDKNDLRLNKLKIFNSHFERLSWEDLVINYMNFLNTFLREQIGVCINKNIPKILDNELTYLIIQRKDYKDFHDNFFIAVDGEVIFPMIKKEYDANLAIIKLAEWKNRANKKLKKFC